MKKVKYMFFIALVIGLLITRVYKNIADAKGNMDYYMLADYDRVIRETRLREDGLQYPDSKKVMERMVELNANTYAHLIWRSEADWKALPEMAIEAEKAGIKLIAYLVPPSEGDVLGKPVPFGYDYVMWAVEIAKIAKEHPALIGIAMDDFNHNLNFFTPSYIRNMMNKAREIAPALLFYPVIYEKAINISFATSYSSVIDGIIYPYTKRNLEDLRTDMEKAGELFNQYNVPIIAMIYDMPYSWPIDSSAEYIKDAVEIVLESTRDGYLRGVMLYCMEKNIDAPKGGIEAPNGKYYYSMSHQLSQIEKGSYALLSQDARVIPDKDRVLKFSAQTLLGKSDIRAKEGKRYYSLSFPWNQPSGGRNYAEISQRVKVYDTDKYSLMFWVRNSYGRNLSAAGYYFEEILIDGKVVWRQDVALVGNNWTIYSVNLTDHLKGKKEATLSLRGTMEKGISNFGINIDWDGLKATGFELQEPGFEGNGYWEFKTNLPLWNGGYRSAYGLSFLQVLLNSQVVWEADAAELSDRWKEYSVDLSEYLRTPMSHANVAFRIVVNESLPQYEMVAFIDNVSIGALDLANPDFEDIDGWNFKTNDSLWIGGYLSKYRHIRTFEYIKELYSEYGQLLNKVR
jgi:hypothetical protein